MPRRIHPFVAALGALLFYSVAAAADDDCPYRCLSLGPECDLSESVVFGAVAGKTWPDAIEYWERELRKAENDYDNAVATAELAQKAVDLATAVVAAARQELDGAKTGVSGAKEEVDAAASDPSIAPNKAELMTASQLLEKAQARLAAADAKVIEASSAVLVRNQQVEEKGQEVACTMRKRDRVLERYARERSWSDALSVRLAASGAATSASVLGGSAVYAMRWGAMDAAFGGIYSQFEAPDGSRTKYFGVDTRLGLKWGEALYTLGASPELTSDLDRPVVKGHFGLGYRIGDDRHAPLSLFGAARLFVEPWISLTGETTQVMFGLELEGGAVTASEKPTFRFPER